MKKFDRSCRILTTHAKSIEIFKGNGIKKVKEITLIYLNEEDSI